MSVVGFDLGNAASVVALAQKRGIDVLLNTEAKRETPTVVYFGDEQRCMGSVAASKQTMYPKNTVNQLKRLIGKTFKNPVVQSDIDAVPFSVVEGPEGDCRIQVQFCGQQTHFAPEQLIAMNLVHLKQIVTSNTNVGVTDCVLSVPGYFTEKERHAMLDATRIAGLNCLRLMDDTAATALAYGIFRSDLSETEPIHVVFVDLGHTSLQVCVVALKKGQLKILSSSWDRNLGGRDFDEALFRHFAEEFRKKSKLNVDDNPKAAVRLRNGCEKTKKMLSTNSEAVMSVECLMEDTDFSSRITRETFEGLCESLTSRILVPCRSALDDAGISIEQIASVEVVGSSSRIPIVQKLLEEFFKKPVSRTLNAKECIARGCALQCAMLSPIFRVRDFEVSNCQPYGISFTWEKDGQPTTTAVFERNGVYPSAKMLSFFRSEPFTVMAIYPDIALLPPNENQTVACYEIGPVVVPKGQEAAKIKVKVKINLHGLLEIDSVQSIEEEEIEVPVEVPVSPESKKTAGKESESKETASMETASNGDSKSEAKTETKMEKKIKTKKFDVPFVIQKDAGLDTDVLNGYFELEGKMAAQDKLYEETQEKKNAVESYVYSLRSRLMGDLADYAKPEESERLMAKLEETEDWLYEDGEHQTKSVYVAKLEELKKLGDPIVLRFSEAEARPAAAQLLNQTCSNYVAMAKSDVEEYNHIDAEEKEKVIKECEASASWLNEKLQMQQQLLPTDDPCVLSTDIYKKQDVVERFCHPIMTKPKPPPPKKEEPKTEESPAQPSAAPEETPKATEKKEDAMETE